MIADERSLARLAALSQEGDRGAYATLLAECRCWLARYYARKLPPHRLDDLVQDTLISLHRKLATYDPGRPFLPWLAAIARYRWVDHLRGMYKSNETELSDDPLPHDAEPAISARISLDRLLASLPQGQAQAIELVKIQGLSIAEASAASDQSASLVKVNIHRGLKRLAAIVEKV